MMAPKIGPRGVTIQDVQDVANNGIRQTGAATYKSAYEPEQPAFSAADLASMLASQRQPGYGQKYAGFPTSSMMEQAILGSQRKQTRPRERNGSTRPCVIGDSQRHPPSAIRIQRSCQWASPQH